MRPQKDETRVQAACNEVACKNRFWKAGGHLTEHHFQATEELYGYPLHCSHKVMDCLRVCQWGPRHSCWAHAGSWGRPACPARCKLTS